MGQVVKFPKKRRERARSRREALTELRVEKLQGEGFILDTKAPNLAVRVTAAGVKSYVWQKRVNGRFTRVTLGKCAGMRLEAARNAAQTYNGDVAKKVDVRAERAQAKIVGATLTDAFEAFKAMRERRPSTKVDHEFLWKSYVPAALKRRSIADIVSADIEAAKMAVIKAGKVRTSAKLVVFLGAILRSAGRRADNPAAGVSRAEPNRRTRRLNKDELDAVLKALANQRGETWPDFLAIAIMTGARRSALQAMQWVNLHLDDGLWSVPSEWSKNKQELAIGLPALAVDILRAREAKRGASPWVWTSAKSETGHLVNPEKPLKALLKNAGVTSRISMHDLRRTLGSRLAMAGANASMIQAALGHLSAQSAKAYLHMDVGAARAAVTKALGLDDA